MKKLLILFSIGILLNSCVSTTLSYASRKARNYKIKKEGEFHSHSKYMNENFKTKEDVIKKFGSPSEKKYEENIEIWIYNFGKITKSKEITKSGNIENETISTRIITNNDFVEFQFKDGENVYNWRSKGIDYSSNNYSEITKNIIYQPAVWWWRGFLIDSVIFGFWFYEQVYY